MKLTPLIALIPFASLNAFAAEPTPQATEHFEKRIRPILAEHCYSCHGTKKQEAGLRLDTSTGFKKGTDKGPVITPGKAADSKLLHAITRTGDFPMPPDAALPKDALALLEAWVKDGAYYPADVNATELKSPKDHWAFKPVTQPNLPAVNATTEIDKFVIAQLNAKGLKQSPEADKRTLIRRAYYDLIGLPPTADEIDTFIKDSDPKAYEKLLDKLLAMPQYGERWARHWLDVARYADTKGYVFTENRSYPFAYTYRDYVIKAFNNDKPINQFMMEQLAADLMNPKDKADLAAMGFLTVGRRFSNNIHDIIDDRIDVVGRGLMGLSLGCARCHDHKFDPIPAADYYSVYGIFASSNEPKDLPLIGDVPRTPEVIEFENKHKKMLDAVNDYRETAIKKHMDATMAVTGGLLPIPKNNLERTLFNRVERDAITKLQATADKFIAGSPYTPPRAMVLNDNAQPTNPVVFLRGNPGNRGPNVPRRMPEIVAGENRQPFKIGSGRLDLAKAIVDPKNPLTARVFVNRVWAWHFGQGLVRTPSDFGIRSEHPTHPELLDWLASQFVKEGWSLKQMHKRILLSATYRQQSTTTPALTVADPENRLLARQNRQRLDFEALRDSLLAASGELDRTVGGRSIDLFAKPYTKRRAVYALVDRQNLPGTLNAFDFASPEQHVPFRFQTTVPQQSLYLMNNEFVIDRAKSLASIFDSKKTDADAAKELYRKILARNPTDAELKIAIAFLADGKPTSSELSVRQQLAQVLLLCNEFMFVD